MKIFLDTTDARNKIALKKLEKLGLCAKEFCGFEKTKPFDILGFSPAKKWTQNEIDAIKPNCTLFCGKVENSFKEILKQKNVTHKNFLEDEIFAIKNANLTAEGVLALVLTHSPKSIFENNILLLGFGRISKACAVLFSKLGLKFKVASFSKEKFEESFFVCKNNFFGFDFVKEIEKFDVIINTRPEKFLEENILKKISPNTLFLETASISCLDEEKAKHFFFLKAPALPQKFSPESAGQIITDKILGEL